MEVVINQTVKKVNVEVNQSERKIVVNVLNQPQKINVLISTLGARGFKGKSNYEIAVDNGFVGTEQQWLDSQNNIDGGLIF